MSDPNAWGKITLKVAVAPDSGAEMPDSMSDLGIVEEDSFSLETEAGEKIQLWGTGHVLVDQKQLENVESLTCTLIVPTLEQITKFWKVTSSGEGDEKYTVHSTMTDKKYSITFVPELTGAIMLEIPKTDVSAQLDFEEKKGWVMTMTFTIVPVQISGQDPVKFYLSKKKSSVVVYTYTPVADTEGKNPASEGWYERSGAGTEQSPYVYTLTEDETPQVGTTYYIRSQA